MRKIIRGLIDMATVQCPKCNAIYDPKNGHWCK